jgi:hypothetical protein
LWAPDEDDHVRISLAMVWAAASEIETSAIASETRAASHAAKSWWRRKLCDKRVIVRLQRILALGNRMSRNCTVGTRANVQNPLNLGV